MSASVDTYWLVHDRAQFSMQYHQHDSHQAGSQSPGAEALLILQKKLSVPQSVEIPALDRTESLARQRHSDLRRLAVVVDESITVSVHLRVERRQAGSHLHCALLFSVPIASFGRLHPFFPSLQPKCLIDRRTAWHSEVKPRLIQFRSAVMNSEMRAPA